MSELTLAELEELERLEREATAGPWDVWSSNSHLRLTAQDGPDGGVCSAMVASDGVPVLAVRRKDIDLIAAARNALPALVAAARELAELKSALEFLAGHGDLFDLWQEEDGVHAETPHGLHGVTAPTAAAALLHHTRRRGWTPPGEQKGEEMTNG